jgi:hypothetical protein
MQKIQPGATKVVQRDHEQPRNGVHNLLDALDRRARLAVKIDRTEFTVTANGTVAVVVAVAILGWVLFL